MPLNENRPFLAVSIAVLTVSDTRTEADDRAGDTLVERLTAAWHALADRAIVKDDADTIEAKLRDWIANPKIDCVITTGRQIIFYCAHGERSAMAVEAARESGIVNVTHLKGGMAAWKETESPLKV